MTDLKSQLEASLALEAAKRELVSWYYSDNVDPTVEALVRRALQAGFEIGAKRD